MRNRSKAPQGESVSYELPESGAANLQLRERAHRLWVETAGKSGIDLNGFDPAAPLAQRITWALSKELSIGTILTRFSSKMQGSTHDQIRVNVEFAACHRIYCPPEFLCVDEATKGRKEQRPGFVRLQLILQRRLATVLLIFKLSRLYRKAHKSVRFIEEEVVEQGLRAVAVTQNVDTLDRKGWRLLVAMHGAMDEELLSAIADHVREGLVGLFLKGWTTGALPVGYKPAEVPGAPLTKRGLTRTMPTVDETAARFIREHFALIAGGMTIKDSWLKWRRDGGPVDKRCTTGHMGYYAYHRMLGRGDYIGLKQFCRKRNQWSSKADTIQQKNQPAEDVKLFRCEELRIVDDATFWKVQKILNALELGPRQRVLDRVHHLWDLVIGLFKCPHCKDSDDHPQRFHMCGAKGKYMHCPNPECPTPAMIDRRLAVEAICQELSTRLLADSDLIQRILDSFLTLGAADATDLTRELEATERRLRQVKQRIHDTEELLGSGTDEDRTRRKGMIRAAEQERSGLELEALEVKRRMGGGMPAGQPITREQVEACLRELLILLDNAAAGQLGPEVVGKAQQVFAQLVGGSVFVHAQRRPGRKRWTVRGTFAPELLASMKEVLGLPTPSASATASNANPLTQAQVWLCKPPRVDQIADEVHRLYEVEMIGFRLINQQLEAKYGQKIGSGNICASWRRWYEARGLPLPAPRTNAGRPRRKAG